MLPSGVHSSQSSLCLSSVSYFTSLGLSFPIYKVGVVTDLEVKPRRYLLPGSGGKYTRFQSQPGACTAV